MAKIKFLGTGGGRFVTISQERATGGWILEMDKETFHIDPGPGALVRAKENGINLSKTTAVFVSHCHHDHYTDAQGLISAMTNGERNKRGTIVSVESVLRGYGKKYNRQISEYFQSVAERTIELKARQKERIGKIDITATPTKHGDPRGVGFVFKGSKTIGYTGDTEYFSGLENHFRDCDILILNALRPRNNEWSRHLNSYDVIKILEKAQPKLALLQHFGLLMMKGVAEKEAVWIEDETGVKTIAAKDGQEIDL